ETRWSIKEDRSDFSRQTYEPYRRGYVFENTPKPEPFEPIEPLFRRKPRPGEFRLEGTLKVLNEPLTDLIDYGTEVNIFKISAKDGDTSN
ncbi:MAG: hypothetical protein QXG97_05540, partial [Nitrososphaerota archaeon]